MIKERQDSEYSISKRLIITIVKNRSNNLKFGQQIKKHTTRYDDSNGSYRSPRMRHSESLCIPRHCETATTTTSRIDHYRTKTKCKFINFKLLGTPYDTTSTENRNKFQNKGSRDWQPLHNYIQQNEIFTTSNNHTTRQLAA